MQRENLKIDYKMNDDDWKELSLTVVGFPITFRRKKTEELNASRNFGTPLLGTVVDQSCFGLQN